MRRTILGISGGSALAAAAAVALAPVAAAQPAPTPPSPILPGTVEVVPGAYGFSYGPIVTGPPAITDARGVRLSDNVGQAQSQYGLPLSQLGNANESPGQLTQANARYNISAGVTPPIPPNPGVNIGAGTQSSLLEDPAGRPPGALTPSNSVAPGTPATIPGQPAPVLESPNGAPSAPPGAAPPPPPPVDPLRSSDSPNIPSIPAGVQLPDVTR